MRPRRGIERRGPPCGAGSAQAGREADYGQMWGSWLELIGSHFSPPGGLSRARATSTPIATRTSAATPRATNRVHDPFPPFPRMTAPLPHRLDPEDLES